MPRCAACSNDAPEGSRFCPLCAAPLASPEDSPTRTSTPEAARSVRPPSVTASSSVRLMTSTADQARFLPGTILADRYRIFGLVGRGGMGEVYRADDLKLGQAVALKFLPAAMEQDEGRLARFLGEVKTARQISHANVCRVYDVGEVDGRHFLSMEFIDGEDLATLLRRIGRLPRDKAVEIARQLCAGLAAAHEQGVLHRDLKPANVMIDGRGRARITDFGIAGLADEIHGAEVAVGTPAYMAPEQLARRGVSVKSDIYALGLVLYELFTGQPAYKASTPGELLRLQTETTPTDPSRLIDGFDPAVERVILRCLEKDPRDRPSSALAVAAALPGGDPLAAALAAGETPSPELVAEAGRAGGLSPPVAVACLASIVVAVLAVIALSGGAQLTRIASPLPPEVLTAKAREILGKVGHAAPPVDSYYGFGWDSGYLDYLAVQDPTPARWARLTRSTPSPLLFWYRESPRNLIPDDFLGVARSDPPLAVSGMANVDLDAQGRLRRFESVPPQRDDATGPAADPDWTPLFEAAEFNPGEFKSVDPSWFPLFYVDRRAAWNGVYPGAPDVPIHVEAAGYRGKPVFFQVTAPWDKPSRMELAPTSPSLKVQQTVNIIVSLGLLIGGALLARRNLRLGRGDRKGAFRLAIYSLVVSLVGSLVTAHHVAEQAELNIVLTRLAYGLLGSALIYVLYIALEPYLRRLWPQTIVSWVRLLNGRLRDPLLGRDILIGLAVGTIQLLFYRLCFVGFPKLGLIPPSPVQLFSWGSEVTVLRGFRGALGTLFSVAGALTAPLVVMVVLLLLRLVLRKQMLAIGAFVALITLLVTPAASSGNLLVCLAIMALVPVTWLFVVFRFGLVALVALFLVNNLVDAFPMTFDLSAWYSVHTLLALLVLAALAGFSFYSSLGGRPVFRDALLAD